MSGFKTAALWVIGRAGYESEDCKLSFSVLLPRLGRLMCPLKKQVLNKCLLNERMNE